MDDVKSALVKLAIEFSKNSDDRDPAVFDAMRTAVTQGDRQATIETILNIAEQGPQSLKKVEVANAFIVDNTPLYLQTAAAIALVYIGQDAQPALIDLIVRQPSRMARHTLFKAVHQHKQPWILDLLLILAADQPDYPSALANHMLREVMYYNNLYSDYLRQQLPADGAIPENLMTDIITRQPDALLTTFITWLGKPQRVDQALRILTDTSAKFYIRTMIEDESVAVAIRAQAKNIIDRYPDNADRYYSAYNLLLTIAEDKDAVKTILEDVFKILEDRQAPAEDRQHAYHFIRSNIYLTRCKRTKLAARSTIRKDLSKRVAALADDAQFGDKVSDMMKRLGVDTSLNNAKCDVCGKQVKLKKCLNCKKVICKDHTSHHSYCSEKCWGDYNYRRTSNPNPQYW